MTVPTRCALFGLRWKTTMKNSASKRPRYRLRRLLQLDLLSC